MPLQPLKHLSLKEDLSLLTASGHITAIIHTQFRGSSISGLFLLEFTTNVCEETLVYTQIWFYDSPAASNLMFSKEESSRSQSKWSSIKVASAGIINPRNGETCLAAIPDHTIK